MAETTAVPEVPVAPTSETVSPTPAPTETAAPAGKPAKSTKPREEVLSKDDLVAAFRKNLKDVLNVEVSNAKAWEIYKVALNTSFELAVNKPLSLSGVGRFNIMDSQRSVAKGKPSKRMRFRPSSRVTALLNEGKSFLSDITKDEPETPAAAPAGSTPSAPVAETAPATAASPAAPVAAAATDLL